MFATWQQSQVNMDGLTVSEGMFVLLPGTISDFTKEMKPYKNEVIQTLIPNISN